MSVRVERRRDCQDGLHFEVFHALSDALAWRGVLRAFGDGALVREERWGPVHVRTAIVPFQLEGRVGDRPGRVDVVFRVGTSRQTRALWLGWLEDALEALAQAAGGAGPTNDPVDSIDSVDPVSSVDSVDSVDPVGSVGSVDPVDSVDPIGSVERSSSEPAYFDAAAHAPCDPRVIELVAELLARPGNAASLHVHGRAAAGHLDEATLAVREAVGGAHEVVWTSGATEANALAILRRLGPDRTSDARAHALGVEGAHPSLLGPLAEASRRGAEVELVPLEADGRVDVERLCARVRPDTQLVSLPHVSSVTGVVQPLAALAARLPPGPTLHVDAAQSFARDDGALAHPRIDAISMSAHKIGGPPGVGALVLRHPRGLASSGEPIRRGTAPVALIAGLGLAVRLEREEGAARQRARARVRERLLQALAPLGPVPVTRAPTASHIACVRFPGFDARALQLVLGARISASLGSACSAGSPTPSHELLAMGLAPALATEAIRFSWTHESEVPSLADLLARVTSASARQRALVAPRRA